LRLLKDAARHVGETRAEKTLPKQPQSPDHQQRDSPSQTWHLRFSAKGKRALSSVVRCGFQRQNSFPECAPVGSSGENGRGGQCNLRVESTNTPHRAAQDQPFVQSGAFIDMAHRIAGSPRTAQQAALSSVA